MTVEEVIVAKLLADSAVTDIIGTKIYPNEMVEGVAAPALVYLLADETPINSQSGICYYETVLFVNCIAKKYSDARTLQKAVIASLDRYDSITSGDVQILITRYVGIRGSDQEKDTGYMNIVLEFKILNK